MDFLFALGQNSRNPGDNPGHLTSRATKAHRRRLPLCLDALPLAGITTVLAVILVVGHAVPWRDRSSTR